MTWSDLERIVPKVSRPWILVAMLVWAAGAAVAASDRPAGIPEGNFEQTVVLSTDVFNGQFGDWAVGRFSDGSVLLELPPGDHEPGRGDQLDVVGKIGDEPGSAAGHEYSAVVDVKSVVSVQKSANFLFLAGQELRQRALDRIAPLEGGRALLAGFLIGDTSGVDDADVEAMRRSGLAHFVAVSGSNVGLFLLVLAVVAGPLALGPRRRALVGLLGLPVYAAITRFEPSVMRASVMAGIALAGRLVGVMLEAWQLLAVAVTALIVLDPSLTSNVGFQLSVVATAGVLIGSRWPVRTWLVRSLAVTVAAQTAVAPLLLIHFGSVPLMSPLVNLVAAPVVVVSTVVGSVGMILPFAVDIGAWLAGLVLMIARTSASWPQLGFLGVLGGIGCLAVVAFRPNLRPMAAVASALVVLIVLAPSRWPPEGSVVVLDVGQGDAILIHGGGGRFALVDGGPDASLLESKLREWGVNQIELAILSHVHADHATGLVGALKRIPVRHLYADTEPHQTSASDSLMEVSKALGLEVEIPRSGEVVDFGVISLRFEGPLRRYASPNDQSVVVTVIGPKKTMLLSGDIETYAQSDLDHLHADVLKVPHQGAGTSDPDWLASVGADTGVISVGPNQFGHPVPWVIATLRDAGVEVVRTDEVGDVVVDLS